VFRSVAAATAMIFFHDIITLLSPFHGLMFMIERLPQAKALVITHERLTSGHQ
jgi:hypothetical protein